MRFTYFLENETSFLLETTIWNTSEFLSEESAWSEENLLVASRKYFRTFNSKIKIDDAKLDLLIKQIYESIKNKIKDVRNNKYLYFKVKQRPYLHLPFVVGLYATLINSPNIDETKLETLLDAYAKYITTPSLHKGNKKIEDFKGGVSGGEKVGSDFIELVRNTKEKIDPSSMIKSTNSIEHIEKLKVKYEDTDNIVHEDDSLIIFHGDSIVACRDFGYGTILCTARTDSSNLFYNYRFKNIGTIYYVYFKGKTLEKYKKNAPHGFVDISLYLTDDEGNKLESNKPPRITINYVKPNYDVEVTAEKVETDIPELKGSFKKILVPRPLTDEQLALIDRIENTEDFSSLDNIADKQMYIELGRGIGDEEWKLEVEKNSNAVKELVEKYIEVNNHELPAFMEDILSPDLWERHIIRYHTKDEETAFDYAEKLNFKNVPKAIEDAYGGMEGISKNASYSLRCANALNFKNVPKAIEDAYGGFKGIAKSPYNSYICANSLNFKNVPDIILQGISKDARYSLDYAKALEFKNVPDILIQSIVRNSNVSFYYGAALNFKNVPKAIEDTYGGLKGVIEDPELSFKYAKKLNFKNVPDIFIQTIAKSTLDCGQYSFDYALSLDFKNVPKVIEDAYGGIKGIAKNPRRSLYYARSFNVENVPDIIIQGISKDSETSYKYAFQQLDLKNVPDIILQGISKDASYSLDYAKALEFKNVPDIIAKAVEKIYKNAPKMR